MGQTLTDNELHAEMMADTFVGDLRQLLMLLLTALNY